MGLDPFTVNQLQTGLDKLYISIHSFIQLKANCTDCLLTVWNQLNQVYFECKQIYWLNWPNTMTSNNFQTITSAFHCYEVQNWMEQIFYQVTITIKNQRLDLYHVKQMHNIQWLYRTLCIQIPTFKQPPTQVIICYISNAQVLTPEENLGKVPRTRGKWL